MSITFKNGKYYYQFMAYGVRKHGLCRGCKSETEAKEFESEVYNKTCLELRGLVNKTEKITCKELFDNFLQYSEVNKKEGSFKGDLIKVNILKKYFKDSSSISTITLAKIEDFKLKIKNDRNLSNATINRYLALLSKAFNLIIIDKHLSIQNPLAYTKKLKENNYKIRYLTKDEEKRLFDVLPDYLKPIVVCALTTGLRLSNVLNLKWETIDFEYNFIEILMQENKGHKKIQIPLSDKFKTELEKIGIKKSGFVFINPKTNKPYNCIKKSFNTALKKAHIDNFRFHDLRHTVATRLVANGADLRTVKEFMAHSNIKTTERYMHPTPENMLNAVNILDNF